MKVCTKCGLEQPEDSFYLIKKTGKRHGSCKTCFKKKSKESRERLGKRHIKNNNLLWNYNITIEQFDQMMEECNGRCACGATKGRSNAEALHVDHSHVTGQIRGLLCNNCNRAIGLVEDPETLRKLADYLESANRRSN